GDVPEVVFPEGAVLLDERLYIYYGAADKTCCLATINLKDLIDWLKGL
ncbi:MAG: glycosidase, partial [Candidatus Omnitrophica bacterium]|nr:glycosidase [Candidatus Omnitrophota bacterium]